MSQPSMMHGLAAQPTSEITIEQQLRAAERELKFRIAVYPRFVKAGKMPGAQKDYEIKCMQAIIATLRGLLPKTEPAQGSLLPQDQPDS